MPHETSTKTSLPYKFYKNFRCKARPLKPWLRFKIKKLNPPHFLISSNHESHACSVLQFHNTPLGHPHHPRILAPQLFLPVHVRRHSFCRSIRGGNPVKPEATTRDTVVKPWKNGGWKTTFFYWEGKLFRGELLKLWEGKITKNKIPKNTCHQQEFHRNKKKHWTSHRCLILSTTKTDACC